MLALTIFLVALMSSLVPRASGAAAPHHLDAVMTAGDRIHLLTRTGFGASPAERAGLDGLTRRQGIDRIIDGLRDKPALPMPTWTRQPLPHYHARQFLSQADRMSFDRARDRELASLRNWWVVEMLQTNSPATERLVLLWHDLVPTAYRAINRQSLAMARQNELFRLSHQGKWADLLKALIRDPALLRYLDGNRNLREHPNENLARELLELFTLGEGHYDESTIREAARALTGHGIAMVADLAFVLRAEQQDRERKLLFGATGEFDGDDLIDLILQQRAAARHLARAYWHHYVSDGSPSDAELDAVADPFRESEHSLAVLYRSVLESEAFWADENRASLVKSPVDIATGMARTLEYPKAAWAELPELQSAMGLAFFDPPNVAGWTDGEAWLAPGRLLARFDAAATLADAESAAAARDSGDGMKNANGMKAAESRSGMGRSEGPRLILDLALDGSRVPWNVQVTLLDAAGAAIWSSPVRTVFVGRKSVRAARHDRADAEPAHERLRFPVAREFRRQAVGVGVAFLDHAAGGNGQRHPVVQRVRLGPREALPHTARSGDRCSLQGAVRTGGPRCVGSLTMALKRADEGQGGRLPQAGAPAPDTPWTASAVRVLGASRDADRGGSRTRLILEHVAGPDGFRAELIQFRVVETDGGRLQLRIGSFECRPSDACVPDWPACAWTNPRFAQMKELSYRLGRQGSFARYCRPEQLPARTRSLFAALGQGLPQLLAHARDGALRRDFKRNLDALLLRMQSTDSTKAEPRTTGRRSASGTWLIDPSFRLEAPLAEPIPTIGPSVADAEALLSATAARRMDPIAGLLPGVDGLADSIAPNDLPIGERLRSALAHPAFQLR